MKALIGLFLLAVCGSASADPATVIAVGATSFTLGTVYAGINYAVFIYGLYQAKRARRAQKDSIEDRTTGVGSTDMARSIVYGERIIGGRAVYVIEASDAPQVVRGITRPANPFFYVVFALEADHPIERIVDVLFDGKSVGPFFGDPNLNSSTGTGNYVRGPNGSFGDIGSPYFDSRTGVYTKSGRVGASGSIDDPGVAITEVLSLVVGQSNQYQSVGDVPEGEVSSPADIPTWAVSGGAVSIHPKYAGMGYRMTYAYRVSRPMVRVWYYNGTQSQANAKIIEMSGGEWNSDCIGYGIPYVVVEVNPDLDMFPNGMPSITVRVKGKRIGAGVQYSTNAADCVADYLKTEMDVAASSITQSLQIAAAAACREQVLVAQLPASQRASSLAPVSVYENRYDCNAILSTEASRMDNLRILLGAMSGSCIYSAGAFDIRAGVPEIATLSLNDSDLSTGEVTCNPEPTILESFNCVRGRIADRNQQDAVTDYPPYKSQFYINQDNGSVAWQEIDLPAVTSAYQAQRIAILQLRLSRNALSFRAKYKGAVAKFSAGEVVNISNVTFGWNNKPFYLTKREKLPDGTFDCTWTESAPAIFSDSYRELTSPDPSPNTGLPPIGEVPQFDPADITILSGPNQAQYSQDGTLRPTCVIRWPRSTSMTVLFGGHIEIWWKFGEQIDFEKAPLLPGDAVQYQLPIERSRQLVIQIRQISVLQVRGKWTLKSHIASDAPTQSLVGNLLFNPEFEGFTQGQRPDLNYANDGFPYVPHWFGPYFSSPTGGTPGNTRVWLRPILNLTDFSNTGFAQWVDNNASFTQYNMQLLMSGFMPVEGSQRLLSYVHYHSRSGRGQVDLEFWAGATHLSTTYGELASLRNVYSGDATKLDNYQVLEVYATAPATADRCRMIIRDIHQDIADQTVVQVYHPFVGYASEGQNVRPPWTK